MTLNTTVACQWPERESSGLLTNTSLAESILQPHLSQARERCPVQERPQNLCSTLYTGHETLPTPTDSTEPQTSRPASLLRGPSETPFMMVPETWRALAALPGLTPQHYRQGDQTPTWGADSSSFQGNRSLLLQKGCGSFFLAPLPAEGSPRLGLSPRSDEAGQLIRKPGLLCPGQT